MTHSRSATLLPRAPQRAGLLLAVLAALLAPPALARKPAPPAPAAAPEKPWPLPKPLQLSRFTLDNGMRVVVQTDRSAPLVAVGLMVDVGSRDEEPGLTGLAHFFEHMMFQGSDKVGKMEHFKDLEAVGAMLNANTSTDRTYFYEVVPKPALELALWLEAERFAHLKIDAANVENQRQTVLEERRERYENQPYAAAELKLEELAFTTFPLRHTTIGDPGDLRKAPLEAFQAFWKKWYTPNNVVLVLVGDLDEAEARALAGKQLGSIQKRAEPQHQAFREAPQDAHVYGTQEEKLGKTPAFHMAWRVPAAPNPDAYALDVLAEALAGGEASRLDKKLTRDRALATQYSAGTQGRRDVDLFEVQVILAQPGANALAEAKRLVRDAIADISLHGLPAEELRRAKIAFEAGYVFGALGAERRAELLAQYELYQGDAHHLGEALPKYRAVTSADVQRVAQTWLTWDRGVELDVLPTGMPPPRTGGLKPDDVTRSEAALIQARLAAERLATEAKAKEESQTRAQQAEQRRVEDAEVKAKARQEAQARAALEAKAQAEADEKAAAAARERAKAEREAIDRAYAEARAKAEAEARAMAAEAERKKAQAAVPTPVPAAVPATAPALAPATAPVPAAAPAATPAKPLSKAELKAQAQAAALARAQAAAAEKAKAKADKEAADRAYLEARAKAEAELRAKAAGQPAAAPTPGTAEPAAAQPLTKAEQKAAAKAAAKAKAQAAAEAKAKARAEELAREKADDAAREKAAAERRAKDREAAEAKARADAAEAKALDIKAEATRKEEAERKAASPPPEDAKPDAQAPASPEPPAKAAPAPKDEEDKDLAPIKKVRKDKNRGLEAR